jgi:RHS repeat-associated protein
MRVTAKTDTVLAATKDPSVIFSGIHPGNPFRLDWYSHGARYYDPQLATWHSPDPLSESSASLSPYAGSNTVKNNLI